MTKGIVLCVFRDKYHFNTEYQVGEVVSFDDERMQDLFNRNICKPLVEQKYTTAPQEEQSVSSPGEVKNEKQDAEAEEAAVSESEEAAEDAKAESEREAAEIIAKATKRGRKKQ